MAKHALKHALLDALLRAMPLSASVAAKKGKLACVFDLISQVFISQSRNIEHLSLSSIQGFHRPCTQQQTAYIEISFTFYPQAAIL